jgi:AbrB family looped-hinge helix DNA binding protein
MAVFWRNSDETPAQVREFTQCRELFHSSDPVLTAESEQKELRDKGEEKHVAVLVAEPISPELFHSTVLIELKKVILKALGLQMPFPKWALPTYNGIMYNKVTLDRAGRVVLPKTLRDELRLSPGDSLDLTVTGDEVTLRPRRAVTPLQKERGVWVFRTGEPLAADETDKTLRNIRAQRHRQNVGETQ